MMSPHADRKHMPSRTKRVQSWMVRKKDLNTRLGSEMLRNHVRDVVKLGVKNYSTLSSSLHTFMNHE